MCIKGETGVDLGFFGSCVVVPWVYLPGAWLLVFSGCYVPYVRGEWSADVVVYMGIFLGKSWRVLALGNVAGSCVANSDGISTLGNMSLRFHDGRFISVLNRSNYNGAALLGVVNKLSGCADNSLFVGNGSAGGCGSES